MTVRLIASAVIAALLLFGIIPSAPQTPENAITNAQAPIAAVQDTAKILSVPEQNVSITAEDAEAIALAHAGLAAADVTSLVSHPDRDDRIVHFDVEFRHGDWEYDYEISEAGAVLKWDKEYEPVQAVPPATEPAPTEAARISPEEAQTIALAHAGLAADQVRGLKAKLDFDDGIWEYEVEFYAGGYEYDYDLNAETGKICSWDKDWDD